MGPSFETNRDANHEVVQAIKSSPEAMEKKRRKMVINGFKKTKNAEEVSESALKRSVYNRIRLQGQGNYFDKYPCVLIIPLVNTDFLRNWDQGNGYDAMVLVSEYDGANGDIC